jgi:hypothetical protein
MANLKAYVEKRLRQLNQTAYLRNLKVDKIIRMKGFITEIAKTKWGCIVFQTDGKRISEMWLTLSEIEAMLRLHDFKRIGETWEILSDIEAKLRLNFLKPIDIDLDVIA